MNLFIKMLPSLFEGSITTLKVFFITLIISLPLSFILAFINNRENRIINTIFWAYIYVERGTPLLLQLMFVYFGLPYLGITLSRDAAIYTAFILNYSAYFMEILRGGINAIDDGQFKAAKVLGYSKVQTFFKIIFPQVIKRILPPVTNETITLVKDTSLAFVIAVAEMFTIAKQIAAKQASVSALMVAGLFYFVFNYVVAFAMEAIEKKLSYYR